MSFFLSFSPPPSSSLFHFLIIDSGPPGSSPWKDPNTGISPSTTQKKTTVCPAALTPNFAIKLPTIHWEVLGFWAWATLIILPWPYNKPFTAPNWNLYLTPLFWVHKFCLVTLLTIVLQSLEHFFSFVFVFWPRHMTDLHFPIRDQTYTLCRRTTGPPGKSPYDFISK